MKKQDLADEILGFLALAAFIALLPFLVAILGDAMEPGQTITQTMTTHE